jgi:glycosyltransferase involved in cell wall biosynthesis
MNSVISIVVMAFNEAKSLGTVVAEINTVLTELNRPYEVLIVDDGSADGNREISAQLAKENSSVPVSYTHLTLPTTPYV